MQNFLISVAWATIVGILGGCGSAPLHPSGPKVLSGSAVQQARSRWTPVDWSELPGFDDDPPFEAWSAWLKSCERPIAPFAGLCNQVRQHLIAEPSEQRALMRERLQPYRVESLQGESTGLLTGYFEPVLEASRLPVGDFTVPLYQPPVQMGPRKPWYSRQEMDTVAEARAALQGRVIAYLDNPVDALMLQTQGSARLHVAQPDGSWRWSRLSFAGSNEQPYRSVARWLLDQGLVRDASWAGIRVWLAQNPQRQQELMWSNPRVVFFREEAIAEWDHEAGPRGAQGVSLTAGRSIAVDPGSVPLGAPVWLASRGPQGALQRLVLAQDTGSAIAGAVRADLFMGGGPLAAEQAGRLRQPLQMWVLWPK